MATTTPRRILQLRTYTLKPGALPQWTTIWQDQIRPLRESLGFTIPAAWTVAEENQFIWLLAYEGPQDWAALDQAFRDSPIRQAMSPDPAALITAMVTCFLEPVTSSHRT